MGKNILIEALRNNGKASDLFNNTGTFVAYKTGFPVLDYAMGFNVNVYNDKGEFDYSYPAIGIKGGSIVTIVGKTHSGKTTIAVQIASNIVRPYDNGSVIHFDVEGGSNPTRTSILSRFNINDIKSGKYIFRQEKCSLEEIKKTMAELYMEKTSKPDEYKYNTGLKDEFGNTIYAYAPTCIIVDSVASVSTFVNPNTKDGKEALAEISTQTDTMRLTAEIGRFLKESLDMMKSANIILILINHIKTKPGMGFPTQPELRYLKSDETLPCGKALQYYSNTMLRITSVGSEKYTKEEHGFEGFGVLAQFMKNRSNVDGTVMPLVFDKIKGYDSLRSSVMYAKSLGLLGGNRNGYYFGDNKDYKFKFASAHDEFKENKELYKVMYDTIKPSLNDLLTTIKPEELEVPEEEYDY